LCRSALFATVALGAGAASANPIVATDPNLIPYTLTYGDFNVVSLQFADTATGTDSYLVQSGPGQLHPADVIGTGPNGCNFANCSTPGVDDPYPTPAGSTPTYFATGDVLTPDPGGAGQFTGDAANSWDIRTSVLTAMLGGQNAVFYFNLNEPGRPQDQGKLSG